MYPYRTGNSFFIDESSRVIEGKRASGYAIINREDMEVAEKGKLPSSWSAQCCEVYALKRRLDLLEGDQGTIYTNSQYAFEIIHTFGKIWEDRGYLNSEGKNLVHERLIKLVLESLQKPAEIAVVHIKSHQRGDTLKKRNQLADQIAKEAALDSEEPVKTFRVEIAPRGEREGEEPIFSEIELKVIKQLKLHQGE